MIILYALNATKNIVSMLKNIKNNELQKERSIYFFSNFTMIPYFFTNFFLHQVYPDATEIIEGKLMLGNEDFSIDLQLLKQNKIE